MSSESPAVVTFLLAMKRATFRLGKSLWKIALLMGIGLLFMAAIFLAIFPGEYTPSDIFITGNEISEGLATYAYFALVIGVILLVIDRIRSRHRETRQ